MFKSAILSLLLASAMVAQEVPKLLTKEPNPASANRAEVNSGYATKIPVLDNPPAINNTGDLSDWAKAYKVEKALMPFLPVDKGEPKYRTDLYMAWGKDGLYVATEVFMDPKEILAPLQARDRDQAGQDQIMIQVDSQGSGNSGIIVAINARNVQADGAFVEGGGLDTSYDLIWKSGTAITPTGWVAKVKIPFSSVRRSPRDWFIQVSMLAVRGGTTYSLNYPQQYNDVQCNICQSVRISGAPVENDANVFMIAPRIYQERTGSLSAGTIHDPEVKNKNGLDFRYQATSYVLEGTYKPDFATIESDVNPLYINNRYKYYYSDKRPFFMNGMDVFGDFANSALNILATRSIIEPEYGLKGNGQTGQFTWNLMQTRDIHGGDSISTDGLASVSGRATSDTAFGTSFAFGGGTTGSKVSLALTDREVLGGPVDGANGPEKGFSRAVGLSLYQQLGQHWSLNAQGVESSAVLPSTMGGDVVKKGIGSYITLNGKYGNFMFSAANSTLDPNLRLDMGFIGLGGIREDTLSTGYILRNHGFWTVQVLTLTYDHIKDWTDAPVSEATRLIYQISMKGPTAITLAQTLSSREWWMMEEFERTNSLVSITYSGLKTPLAQGKLVLTYSQSKGIDYARVTSDLEKTPQVEATLNVGPFYMNAQWMSRSIFDYATGALNQRATRLYMFVEQVLPYDFFWRVQYQPVRYFTPLDTNPWMPTDTTIVKSVQYLGGWRPNPFSGFYVGYNQVRGTAPTAIDPRNEPVTEKGLFLKATYAFTF